ncbi:alpha-(1,3)-fucosyltransferase 10-like [Pectinophora gossypiella]|uniref:alpha-(1,3)-fucosyltransferase 10-like n=1 Tax=Pectinophora gossypiella TaxID=13191 RepID=UPI00214E5A65|nr:alpha-(1,3)-fucosyltransferase 10-like [Pectinophora gossypiella]
MFMYEKALNLFNYSATFGRNSNVPMPLIWIGGRDIVTDTLYFVNTLNKNELLSEISPVLFLQSDCFTPTEREIYVDKLMKYIQVDSYGRCLNNKKLPLSNTYKDSYQYHLNGEELLEFIAKYKFMIAIENCICNDYVTEKFWRAIKVGVVPIYYGSPLIRDWLPNNKSAILLEDFPTPELLSQHLHYLLNNDTAYEEYLEHKTLGKISNEKLVKELQERAYQTDLDAVVNTFECFICERLYDEKKQVNIVNKSHYDCPEPYSALSLCVNPENPKLELLRDAKEDLDKIYKEIENSDMSYHGSNMTWW